MFAWLKKIINRLKKKEQQKVLGSGETTTYISTNNSEKEAFINSLKVNVDTSGNKSKVETLISPGDGLGIDNKMEC